VYWLFDAPEIDPAILTLVVDEIDRLPFVTWLQRFQVSSSRDR